MPDFIIDGQRYESSVLTDHSRSLMFALKFAEQEIWDINRRVGLAQTARNTYCLALKELLPAPLEGEMSEQGVLNFGNQKFARSELSQKATQQLNAILEVDKLLADLQDDYAIAETARTVYGRDFKASVSTTH
ncbi:hypothetical protein [Marinomonas gallaica]|uniref:hypothetical protein n=1 Tax=Marinomonas gallaica TaxID=1806667 RepID=UPI003A919BDA